MAHVARALVPFSRVVLPTARRDWGNHDQYPRRRAPGTPADDFSNYFGRAHAGSIQRSVRPFITVSSLGGPVAIAFIYDRMGSFDLGLLIAGAFGFVATILAFSRRRRSVPGRTAGAPGAPNTPQPTATLESAGHAG